MPTPLFAHLADQALRPTGFSYRVPIAVVVLCFCAYSTSAQQVKQQTKLMRVDEGVFVLTEGSAIDLTDRKIVLAIPPQNKGGPSPGATRANKEPCSTFIGGDIEIMVFGVTKCVRVGDRVDLRLVEPNSFPLVQDLGHCLLDVTAIAKDTNQKIRTTFRLSCK